MDSYRVPKQISDAIVSNSPKLSKRLYEIGLDPKIKAYSATHAILGAFSIFQSGVIDRENKAKLNKLVEHLDRLEREPSENEF